LVGGGVDRVSVDSYDVDTGVAVLTHSGKAVGVDVSLLVDGLRFTLGQWLNVIGYVEQLPTGGRGEWLVRAIMVWPVSPGFNLAQYEKVMESRMEKP